MTSENEIDFDDGNVPKVKLSELYKDDQEQYDITKIDIKNTIRLLVEWLDDEPIDPHLANYLSMMFGTLAEDVGLE